METPEAKGGGPDGRGKTVADVRQGLFFERLPLVSSADKAPSVSVPPSHRSGENLDLVDAQASGEASHGKRTLGHRQELSTSTISSANKAPSVSVTPSHSQDHFDEDNIPAAEGAPLAQQGSAGGVFKPTFSTPAHSRDRDASSRPPPLAAAPTGSGTGSRRVHRERHHNSEDIDATSTEGVLSAEESAPVHASPSPTASLPLKAVNRPRGSANKKRYSYVSDNTWLKPKEDVPEPAPSPLELGTASVPGECSPIQRNTHSSSASGSAPVPIVGTAEDAASLTARSNRHGFPSEAEQQDGHDVLAEGVTEVETSAQGRN